MYGSESQWEDNGAGANFGVSNMQVVFMVTELDKIRLEERVDREQKKAKDRSQSMPKFRDSAEKKQPTNETEEQPVR